MKRSAQVGLIMMGGAVGVGSLAYLVMPPDRCRSDPAYASAQPSECAGRSSSSGSSSSGGSGRYSSYSSGTSDSATAHGGSGAPASTAAGGVQRGGFGSFLSSLGSHFSSGGG